MPKGNRKSIFEINGKDADGGTLHIVQTKIIDTNAYPISETEVTEYKKGRVKSTTFSKVHYDSTGAAILDLIKDGSKITTRSFVVPLGLSRADESDLWFDAITPRPGTTITSTVFDIEKAKWQRVETTYIGKSWITISGNSVEANEVRDVRDGVERKVYLDRKGMPVLMTNGRYRTEKHL